MTEILKVMQPEDEIEPVLQAAEALRDTLAARRQRAQQCVREGLANDQDVLFHTRRAEDLTGDLDAFIEQGRTVQPVLGDIPLVKDCIVTKFEKEYKPLKAEFDNIDLPDALPEEPGEDEEEEPELP